MQKFKCSKCGYEGYPRNKERTDPFKKCPYCGSENTMQLKRHILEELDF